MLRPTDDRDARVFREPRTTIGWKGLINDPDLDGRFDIRKGMWLARKVLTDVLGLGLRRDRMAGSDYTAVHLRSDQLGGDRRAQHGVAGAS